MNSSTLSLVPATSSVLDRSSSVPEPYSASRKGMVPDETSGQAGVAGLHETPALVEPYPEACFYCLEEWNEAPELGVDDASVLFDGTLACGFHAEFMWHDQPARVFREVVLCSGS